MSSDTKHTSNFSNKLDRRKFIGAAAATAGILLIKPELVRGTAANSAVRVGLLGCGGRSPAGGRRPVDTRGPRRLPLAAMLPDPTAKAPAHLAHNSEAQQRTAL